MLLTVDVAVSHVHPSRTSLPKRLLARLLEAEAQYRQVRRLEEMPDERLRDMGLQPSARPRCNVTDLSGSTLW